MFSCVTEQCAAFAIHCRIPWCACLHNCHNQPADKPLLKRTSTLTLVWCKEYAWPYVFWVLRTRRCCATV